MKLLRDNTLMKTAMLWAEHGTCSRAQVGCVISRDGRGLTNGYNGAPAGMTHCDHGCNCDGDLIGEGSEDNFHLDSCHSLQPCTNAVHAEANALAFAARYGVATDGAELHTTRIPCMTCAGLIINAGIVRVVWYEEHRDMSGLLRLGTAGLDVVRWGHDRS